MQRLFLRYLTNSWYCVGKTQQEESSRRQRSLERQHHSSTIPSRWRKSRLILPSTTGKFPRRCAFIPWRRRLRMLQKPLLTHTTPMCQNHMSARNRLATATVKRRANRSFKRTKRPRLGFPRLTPTIRTRRTLKSPSEPEEATNEKPMHTNLASAGVIISKHPH